MDKSIASITLGILCGFMMYSTHSEHGIGWFVFGLIVIWNVL